MKVKIKGVRLTMLLAPALVLAAPAFAQVRAPTLSDSQEPGSVIVFPKFIQGTTVLPEGAAAPINRRRLPKGCSLPRARAGKNQISLGLRHD